MRRILLIVAMLLLATPALAAITVSAYYAGSGVVEVNYVTTGEPNVRAYALNLSLSNGATIDAIRDFKVGDTNGFGIFPGKFRDYINAATPNFKDPCYNPVAPPGDRDALTGLGTGGITVEMGALYTGAKPAGSGRLFTIDCNLKGAISSVLTIATNATRGGPAVLEDGTVGAATLTGCTIQDIFPPAAPAWIKYANYDPDCNVPIWWAAAATATDYNLEVSTKAAPAYVEIRNQLATDPNCNVAECNWGYMKIVPDTNYHWRVRAHNLAGYSAYTTREYDCNVILSVCYKDGNTADANWAQWRNLGRPDCWCRSRPANQGPRGAGYQCDGDTAGDDSGPTDYFRIYNTDLAVVTGNWKKTRAAITADPNTTGSGSLRKMAACGDIDHRDTGPTDYFRVYNADLGVVTGNWKKHNSSWSGADRLPGNCPR